LKFIFPVILNLLTSLVNLSAIWYLNNKYIENIKYSESIANYSLAILYSLIIGMAISNIILSQLKNNRIVISLESKLKLMEILLFILLVFLLIIVEYSSYALVFAIYLLSRENIFRSILINNKKLNQASFFALINILFIWGLVLSDYFLGNDINIINNTIFVSVILNIFMQFLINKNFSYLLYKTKDFKLFINKFSINIFSNLLGALPQVILLNYLKLNYLLLVPQFILFMYIYRSQMFIPQAIQKITIPYITNENSTKFIFIQQFLMFLIFLIFLIFLNFINEDYLISIFGETNNIKLAFLFVILMGLFSGLTSPYGSYYIKTAKFNISLVLNMCFAIISVGLLLSAYLYELKVNFINIFAIYSLSYFLFFILSLYFYRRTKNDYT
jgi:hypothetical protein